MNSKKLGLLILAIAIVVPVIAATIVFGFGPKKLNFQNPEFTNYISAYTSGIISKTSSLKIKLLSDISEQIKDKESLPDGLFNFSPDIDGEYYWLDENTIEFVPEKPFPSDETIVAEFYIGKLLDMPDDLEAFVYEFKTIKQSFDLSIIEQKTIDKQTLKWQQAIGVINIADYEELENIKQIVTAKQDGKTLNIKWKEDIENKAFYFTIDSIQRKEKASKVKILWDGDPIDVDIDGEKELPINAIDDFEIISTKVIQQPEQYLQIQFSDPLKADQNLRGLITVKDKTELEGFRFIIEDNTIRAYPPNRLNNTYKVQISVGIKNTLGYKLKKGNILDMSFMEIKPAVRLLNKGAILPSSEQGLVFPFEAVNLKAVDVKVIRVFEKNIIQFLQVNNYEGDNQLVRVGKPVYRKTIKLENKEGIDLGSWNRFTLDLNKIIKSEPGAIYRISIGFRKQHSVFDCENTAEAEEEIDYSELEEAWGPDDKEHSNWDYYDYYYYSDDYWENRDNPCHKAYYGKRRTVAQNIIASNFGMIAKKGKNHSLHAFITDIRTTKPVKDVEVEIYDYQNQLLATKKTSSEGVASFDKVKGAYFVIAKQDEHRGYLKISDGNSLSLSRFDVSGTKVTEGLKGYIYGERGVWRPGDSIYLTFVLKEQDKGLPSEHPIILEFKNPQFQLVKKEVQKKNNSGFYLFRLATKADDPTGNYEAKITVGGATFNKNLKIETVKPNRLKIKLDFGTESLEKKEAHFGQMNVKWLHGAIAKNLDATVDVMLSPVNTTFPKYSEFEFDDQTKSFNVEPENIFEGTLDGMGKAEVSAELYVDNEAPGKLQATFVTKVFEKGGNFSIDQFSIPFYPYKAFVGIRLPKGDKVRGMLLTDTTHNVEIAVLDAKGNPVKENHKIEMEFYKLKWSWWWESNKGGSNYISRNSARKIKSEIIDSKNGKANWGIKIKYPDWGRYLVRAVDQETGHSSSKIVYIDWPGWAGRAQKETGGAALLSFVSDKTKYNVGEKATLTIPSGTKGRALISIENGTEVLRTIWKETEKGETKVMFDITEEMAPNIFVNVSLLQPHSQTANDLPIRLYGAIPIMVEDPDTHLEPVISMPDELEAESNVRITVSEKNNKDMTYTVAVVDEGLLDLTRFQTPDPWKSFFSREALGVKTWDLYDWVIGAYGGKLERLFSIGGDDEYGKKKPQKANRFQPVVIFLGPYHLKGGKKTHTIKLPKYIGSVRTMVVAGNGKAYGSAEKATPVTKPLMVVGTLPRVLGPQEKVKLPVSIFSMKKSIKNVSVTVKTNKLLKVNGPATKTIKFSDIGEEYTDFDIDVASETGIGEAEIIVQSGSYKSSYRIELDVRNPNPAVIDVIANTIEANKDWSQNITPFGIKGSNSMILEVSSVPAMNLEKRLQYLIKYPHGCIEQTTSGAFPQLFLTDLLDLNNKQKAKIDNNIKSGIQRLTSFQLYNGGMGYWPNSSDANEWGTNYAGHFMILADKKGYTVPYSFLKKWKKYQRTKARKWTDDGKRSEFTQAYRLYTLALAGEAEIGAMNRLKEFKKLPDKAKWHLAAAYYLAGKKRIAEKLVEDLKTNIPDYTEMSYTYGSGLRDKAIILEVFTLLEMKEQAFELMREISEKMSTEKWYSTQTTAYSLIAISQFITKNKLGDKLAFSYTINGKTNDFSTKKSIAQIPVTIKDINLQSVKISNKTKGMLYARIINKGTPAVGVGADASNNLILDVIYKDLDGSIIKPEKIEQGTDFIAEVKVKNPGLKGNYKELALSQIFPSGWEIINTRMFNVGNFGSSSTPTYQDIRDDRVYTYFDLNKKSTKTFRVLLNASYMGKFYLPMTYAEVMYDGTINARKKGAWVEVVKPGEAK